MKTIILCAIVATLCCIIGCGQHSGSDSKINPIPIKLNKQLISLDGEKNISGSIQIMSGNGKYSVVFPKLISIDGKSVPFSNEILTVTIKNDNTIVAERKLLDKSWVTGLFLLKDNKGEKRLFAIDQAETLGRLYDFEELESEYMHNLDYWQ